METSRGVGLIYIVLEETYICMVVASSELPLVTGPMKASSALIDNSNSFKYQRQQALLIRLLDAGDVLGVLALGAARQKALVNKKYTAVADGIQRYTQNPENGRGRYLRGKSGHNKINVLWHQ